MRRSRAARAITDGYREAVDGRQHPELLLPYELFDALLRGLSANPRIQGNARTLLDRKLRNSGFDPSRFWPDLERIAQPYLSATQTAKDNRHNSMVVTAADGSKMLIPVGADVCQARIEALQNARRTFGAERFDRFLYVALAPDVSVSSAGSSGSRPDQLRYMARGCR